MTVGLADGQRLADESAGPLDPTPPAGPRRSRRFNLLVSGVALVALGWGAYASLAMVSLSQDLKQRTRDLEASRTVGESLQGQLAALETQATRAVGELGSLKLGNHSLALELKLAERTLAGLLAERAALTAERDSLLTERSALAEARDSLADRSRDLEAALADSRQRQGALEETFDTLRQQAEDAVARASDSLRQRDELEGRVDSLQAMIDQMRDQQREIVDRVAGRTVTGITDLESLVAATGLDVGLLVDRAEGIEEGAQGGPFIPADTLLASDAAYELQLSVATLGTRLDRLDALQRVAQVLPLMAPLETYEITSKFGYRRDPINGLQALHTGVDFAAAYKAPVEATGPGVVTFAGWRGQYGRVVEIDHGFGIKTRFAHLSKIEVKKGQQVAVGEEIGTLGSSGRVTGPHVHYEVLFDNKPIDPMRFLDVGLRQVATAPN